ncbi:MULTISPECIES: sensor histidine kinase [unclassified Crossiella]|uniref:sensor histidine kinase n=1 Tax=unclassified Crossiella TaxID=2620835 RepID=UPI001FFEC37F|nr:MULTISPECIES: sensor histidine kinase [unclassified Crossiella]MCK2237373.1 sensor domain-containing protein [Crossiella sp. S99.2]MCK2251028.1 sensor domain-containing protein [Crossiella sp. S99.1]
MTETTAPSRVGGSLKYAARSALYLLSGFPLSTFWFVLFVTLLSVSAGTAIIWVGVFLFFITLFIARGAASLERLWLGIVMGHDVSHPYRPLPVGGPLGKLKRMITDPATWRDLVFLVVLFPVRLFGFVFGLLLVTVPVSFLGAPFWYWTVPGGIQVNLGIDWSIDTLGEALLAVPIGLLLAIPCVAGLRGLGWVYAQLAAGLLRPSSVQSLTTEATELRASRARGVDAAEAERRRIERDLHDGAQQRLVSVAMELGRAKAKLDSDPAAARVLIDGAHSEAKQAIAELRDLARGIYPAVLGDRGLDAALSALAGRCPVPVHVSVELPQRPPTVVESTAYYIVAEALTNVAKHAKAVTVAVTVQRHGDRVLVEIYDDGRGGATAAPGGGLAGLADRAATIDGVLTVDSPEGGPTKIRAELPCTW